MNRPLASIVFLRSTDPQLASFRVPLWFSKLDIRDYLWHAYGVEIYSVRSYVKQQRVEAGNPNKPGKPAARRWHRPRSWKFMTCELAKPFVWPEEPEDLGEWNAKEVRAAEKEAEKCQERNGTTKDTMINEERRERMKEQAKALLEGKAKWKPPAQKMATQMYSWQ